MNPLKIAGTTFTSKNVSESLFVSKNKIDSIRLNKFKTILFQSGFGAGGGIPAPIYQ